MVNWFTARTIVQEPSVSAAVDRYTKKYARFDEAYQALEWLLARKCETLQAGMRTVKGVTYHLYRQAADALAGTPAIVIVYTYDQNEVVIIDLKVEKTLSVAEDE